MDALDLLSGDAQGFLAKVWARRAHIHKADPDRLGALLSLDDADALLTSAALRTPALRVAKDGSVLPTAAYTRQATIAGTSLTGLVDARKVLALFDGGATLVLQGLHRYWPPLTELIRSLERALGHPAQANAYLTPPGSQGFALHSDTHDVFVFQTHGCKQWEVHDQEAELDVLMEPGTSMYLPAGTPHAARTQETASLHVTVGINQLTYRELLRRIADEALADPTFDERLPAGYLDDPGLLAAGLSAGLRVLADGLADLDVPVLAEQQATRFLSTRSSHLRGAVVDSVTVGAVDDDTLLERRPGAVCVVRRPRADGERVTLLLGDRRLFLPGWLTDVLEHIATLDALRPRDLTGRLDPQSRLVLVRRLIREGLLRTSG